MLNEALSFPTDGDDWQEPFLFGSLLLLGSFFVGITVIPLYGYYLRVIDAGRTGSRDLPQFEDWEELMVDGIKMFAVNFIYAGVPGIAAMILGFFTLFGIGFGVAAESGAVMAVVLVMGGLLTLIAGGLWLVGSLVAPAALAHMRAEGDLGAALDFRTVLGIAKNADYLIAVVLAMAVGGVVSIVGVVLSLFLVGLPILFFGGIVTFHLYGQGYQRARKAKYGRRGGATTHAEPV